MIAAFDMGTKNFAFAVKDKGEFVLLKNTSLTDANIMTKTELNKLKIVELTNVMSKLQIDHNNKLLKKDMINLILSKNKKHVEKKDLGLSMFQIMDENKAIWDQCEIFLIERQMTINLQALKLSHYLEAYLKIYYPKKKILNYNATTKTKKLGAINLKTKKDRKDWTILYVSNLLTDENLRYFQSLNKKDDIADVICMIESYTLDQKNQG